ncbi:MAG: hypothetical protein PHP62_03500 [Candidatus Moranbacteria bacterium]|nr:hypothetical protein [Candidatus Moranbacteria bacterium]
MKKYFTGKINNKTRILFAIEERKNNEDENFADLLFTFPGDALFMDGFDFKKLINSKREDFNLVKGPHLSVHYHPSKDTIFLKNTSIQNNSCEISGIKDKNLFAPVLLKIVGKNFEKKDLKNKHLINSENIGIDYKNDNDTLVLFFLVSKSDVKFNIDLEYPANYFNFKFKDFRLTLVYRFFNSPSIEQSINFFITMPPPSFIEGLEWWQACNLLNDLQNIYNDAYFKLSDKK